MNIVDKNGLAEILLVSVDTIYKTWHEYPHFFVGTSRTPQTARFDVNDVVAYLKDRDYAVSGQEKRNMGRSGQNNRPTWENETRIPDKGRGRSVGVRREGTTDGFSGRSGLLSIPSSR